MESWILIELMQIIWNPDFDSAQECLKFTMFHLKMK